MHPFSALKSAVIITGLVSTLVAPTSASAAFLQTNLVSDIPGLAAVTDANLKNPWGVSFGPTTPFWVSDQVTGVATLYNAAGVPQPTASPLIVTIPGTGLPGPQGPTGQVFNSTTGFRIGSTPSTFIFATLGGNIDAWNGSQGTTAAVMHTTPNAVYTGLTLAGNQLFAANKGGSIDVFDTNFNPTTVPGGFVDANVPIGLTPYDIQNIGGNFFVEYSGARFGPGAWVAEFDANGNLLRDLNDPHLNAPWGIVLAPAGFGAFGGDLLIGNFNDGLINAFDPNTLAFRGTLTDALGHPIANPGLWSLAFRNTSSPNANTGTDPDALFITAGINREANGLFARITTVAEPASYQLLGLALVVAIGMRKRGVRTTS